MTQRKPKELHMKRGRPTSYKPAYCEKVIEWGRLGKSRTWIAAMLGISRSTLDTWEAANPDFSDAMETAAVYSQLWWEDAGQDGMKMPGFNAAIWSRSMSARFPREWREVKTSEISGPGGKAIEMRAIPVGQLSEAALREIAALDVEGEAG